MTFVSNDYICGLYLEQPTSVVLHEDQMQFNYNHRLFTYFRSMINMISIILSSY